MSSKYHHGNLRADLLEAASKVLEESGAGAISLRGLARSLEVSHAAPGHHFSHRAELLAELAADGYAALADAMERAMASSALENWQTEIGHAYIRFALDNPERYRLMFASRLMAQDCPERLERESGRAYMALLRAVHRGEPDADPEPYEMQSPELGAWAVVHGAVMLWIDGQLGAVRSRQHFEDLVARMLE